MCQVVVRVRFLVLLLLSRTAASLDEANLTFVFNSDGIILDNVIDMPAMQRAAATLRDIFKVVAPVPPERTSFGAQEIFCDPFFDTPIQFDPSVLARGQVYVFLLTYGENMVGTCKTSVAFTQMCMVEEPYNMPLVAYINVCPGSSGSLDYESSTHEFRYRAYMHEMIHIMGFTEPFILDVVSVVAGLGGDSDFRMVTSPTVLNWAMWHYGCPHILGVPISADCHWDPYFVGSQVTYQHTNTPIYLFTNLLIYQDIMVHCITEDSFLTPATIALLGDLGPYRVDYDSFQRNPDIIRQSPYGRMNGCDISLVKCGSLPYVGDQSCAANCMKVGDWIITPNPRNDLKDAYYLVPDLPYLDVVVYAAKPPTEPPASRVRSMVFIFWLLGTLAILTITSSIFWK